MADKFSTHLYDAGGGYVGTLESEHDLMGDPYVRDQALEHGGKTYVWNQRNMRWQEPAGTLKVSGKLSHPDSMEGDKPITAHQVTDTKQDK